ncbi:unnamed protein product [Leuciscus chuanchicus]
MDLVWKRVPMLLILLIFLKHAFGQKGWSSHDVLPRQKWHDHKIASPWGAQSSVLEAPVTGSIPFEEVASNVLAGKSLNSRSRFSLSRQYVEGGLSSSHASMSHTQSAPSSSVSASLALPQNLLAASHQYVPTLESSSGSSSQPQGTTSQYAPILSLGAKVPVSSQYYPATLSGSSQSLSQSSQKWQPSTSGTKVFQPSSTAVLQGFQTSGAWQSISQYPSRFGSLSSASADGSSLQLQGTSSQYAPASLAAEVPVYSQAAPSEFSLPTSQPSQWQPSTSRWSQGFQASGTATSQSSSPSQGSKSPKRFSTLTSAASPGNLFSTQDGSDRYSGLFSQSQSASSQYTPTALDAEVPVYIQAAPSGFSLPMSQPSQWQPSTSRWSQGFQASGTVASQISSPSQGSKSPRRFSTLASAASPGQSFSNVYTSSSLSRAGAQLAGSSRDVPMQTGSYSADGSSLQLQGTSSQYAPASLVSKVPPYKPAAPSGSLSLSQPSQWQPSTSMWSQGFQASGKVASQGFQTSGTATSQSSSPSQGSKFPSRFSTLTSAASPDQSISTQDGSGSYSGLFSQSQSASSQYVPAPLDAEVPVYSQAAPSGFSLPTSQPSQWQPSTSRWSQGFQASGTVASQGFQTSGTATSQSSSPTQGSKSTLTSASPGNLFSTQDGSGRYSGLFSQSQSASSQYVPAPLDAEVPVYSQAAPSGFSLPTSQPSQWQPSTSKWSQGFQASGTVPSQSSSPSQGSKSTSRLSTLTSAASPDQSFSTQDGSGRYSGLSSQSQSASIQYNPGSPAYAKRGFSLFDSSRQSTGDQSSSPQFSSGSSSMAALSLPVDSVAQSSSSNSWRTSSLSGVGLRPSMLSKAASGSIRRQMSPGLFGSVQHPTDSTTYGQKPSWRDFSSVKG